LGVVVAPDDHNLKLGAAAVASPAGGIGHQRPPQSPIPRFGEHVEVLQLGDRAVLQSEAGGGDGEREQPAQRVVDDRDAGGVIAQQDRQVSPQVLERGGKVCPARPAGTGGSTAGAAGPKGREAPLTHGGRAVHASHHRASAPAGG